jgi:3-hydroxyacyl-[acyl-carrier-protein] dehydratase
MLKDDFFTISSIQKENNSFKIMLELNAMHKIFEGHFPGQPVIPGACMLQMVKEITETILSKQMRLTKAENLKFLLLINPNEHRTLQMDLTCNISEYGIASVSANLSNGSSVCFKFIGSFQASEQSNLLDANCLV